MDAREWIRFGRRREAEELVRRLRLRRRKEGVGLLLGGS